MLPKKLQGFFQEFGIVSVTLGIIIGASSVKLLQSFVDNLFMPLVRPLISDTVWENAIIQWGPFNFRVGPFLGDLFSFFLVVLLTYIFIRKILKYHRKR